jgi:hypothetical protein
MLVTCIDIEIIINILIRNEGEFPVVFHNQKASKRSKKVERLKKKWKIESLLLKILNLPSIVRKI